MLLFVAIETEIGIIPPQFRAGAACRSRRFGLFPAFNF